MGGRRTSRVLVGSVTASFVVSITVGACSEEAATTNVVEPADAYTAIIEWQAAVQDPVLDDAGTPELPVIYVVAADGATVDVGVQAAVAEATVNDAVVRFADDVTEGFDADLDGAPVHDDGVMLAVGAMPVPARAIEVEVARFVAEDVYEQMTVEITVTDQPATGTAGSQVQPAEVTAVTPR